MIYALVATMRFAVKLGDSVGLSDFLILAYFTRSEHAVDCLGMNI